MAIKRRNIAGSIIMLVLVVGVIALITAGIITEKNLSDNVQADRSCNVVSKNSSKTSVKSKTRNYYIQTSDCGKLMVSSSDYHKISANTLYTVDIHGDSTIQQRGKNWRKL